MQPLRVSGRVLIAGAVVLSIAGWTGAALAPALLTEAPLLLVALAPRTRHLVVAATVTSFLPLLATATARRMLTCVLAYLAGSSYGEQGLTWTRARHPRMGRVLTVLLRWLERFGPILLVLIPLQLMCALAGVARIRFWLFLVLTTLGQMMYITASYRVGAAFSEYLLPIVDFFREYVVETTILFVVIAAVYAWLQRNRQTLPTAADLPPAEPSEGR